MQLTHVVKALRDPAPAVRAAAAAGACRLLASWWELLPAQAITKLMVLLQETALDAGSPSVPIALMDGLSELVTNPLARVPVLSDHPDGWLRFARCVPRWSYRDLRSRPHGTCCRRPRP